VACSALLLTLLWTAFPGTETLVAVNLPVVVLNATVSALIALAWAYRRTPYEDWRRRQWIRIGQWAGGILCAVEAVFTAFVLWAAYALASGDPWGNLRF
jgi:hypothetical protein